MSKEQAIKELESMPKAEFQQFFTSLPARVQLLVKGGLVDWKDCLAEWYIGGVK